MKYNALIFDFNGVLWWDTEIQEEAWQQTAVNLRGRPFDDQELHEHLHGRNNRHTLEHLLAKSIDTDAELYELTQLKESNYRQKCLDQGDSFRLSPGAEELLDFLKSNQIPITIATASEITNLKFFFEHLNLAQWFDFDKVIFDDGTRPGKPAPDIYLAASQILSQIPSDCVVIEDAKSGIQAANSAGIGYIIALGPIHKHRQLKELPGVKNVIEQLDQVVNLDLF